MRRSVGKIDTNTILLIGAAAVGVYFLTRPKTPTPVQTVLVPSGGGSGTSANQYVALGTALANGLSNIF